MLLSRVRGVHSNSPYLSKYFGITVFHQNLGIYAPSFQHQSAYFFSLQDSYHPALGTSPPSPPPPHTCLSQYLKIAHLFLIHGPVSPSRQQFSQNYSCIKPEDTILWHCKMIYLSVILVILTIIIRQLRTHLHLHYSISGTPRSEAQDVSHHRNE